MNKLWMYIPKFETILIWIGGIPTIFTTIGVATMVFFTARNKALSLTDLRNIRNLNKEINYKEERLRNKILSAPRGVQWLYRMYIGEINYHDLIQRR